MNLCPTVPLTELGEQARTGFLHRFGRPSTCVVAAPGRVNLIGEHVDYNDGLVLPMALDRYVVLAAARRETKPRGEPEPTGRAWSELAAEAATIQLDADAPRRTGSWVDYVQGVVSGFAAQKVSIPAFDCWITSCLPPGGGLSSSAALEVAIATMLESLTEVSLDPVDKALLCQQAEHDFAGVPCGIMDQFSSVMCRENHVMLLDCRSRQIAHVPFDGDDIAVLIANSNIRHALAGSEYAKRRQECQRAAKGLRVSSLRDCRRERLERDRSSLDDTSYRRARHVVSEIERTRAAITALGAGDWERMGELMYASHLSLRDDYEVSCDELNILVEIAKSVGMRGGVVGSRMTGGGFGGCTVSLVRADRVTAIAKRIGEAYRRRTKIDPSLYVTRPSRGASVI